MKPIEVKTMNDLNRYEDGVTDVIIGLDNMENISPSDIVAIYQILTKHNVQQTPVFELYYLFEKYRKEYQNVSSVFITPTNELIWVEKKGDE